MSHDNNVRTSNKWKNAFKISIILIISIFLMWFLLTKITIDDIKTVFSKVNPLYLILGFFIYIFSYIFRSIRFYFLLGKKIGIKALFLIVCVHNMINMILPARTGELSYIYLLKEHNIPLEERITTLAIARMFDFIIIASFFLVSVLFLRKLPGIILSVFWVIAICLIALVILLCGLLYFGDTFKRAVNKLAIKLKMHRFKTTNLIIKIIEDTILSFKIIKSRRIMLKTVILSIFIWMTLSLLFFLYTKAFQIELEFFEIIVIVSLIALLPLLPFYGAGGFGTTEATLTIFFMAFSITESVAIVASFGIHIVALIYIFILGIGGSLKYGLLWNSQRKGKR